MLFPALNQSVSLADKLACIERRELEGAALQFPEHLPFIADFTFHRLRGKPKPLLSNGPDPMPEDIAGTLLLGLYPLQTSFCYLIESQRDQIGIFVGSRRINGQETEAVHLSILEGFVSKENIQRDQNVSRLIRNLADQSVCGAITGIPIIQPVLPSMRKAIASDKWLKGLQGERWTYLVTGFCLSRELIAGYESQLIAEIAQLRARSIREDILYEDKRLAEHYQMLIEAYLKRLEQGRLAGAWQSGIYFFAGSESLIRQGLGMISAHFGNKRSIIQPVRAHLCYKNKGLSPSFSNLLTSSEAAAFLTLPEEEVPGYAIRQIAHFDTDFGDADPRNSIEIGNIIRNWVITENTYTIGIPELTKHGLVAGVTGSGKTTTCLNILRQLRQKGLPFLVIESAKSEYRQLLADPLFSDMLVFTLGDETPGNSAPFRINPFEVPEGILIQTHLDYLKSLFRASFILYAPMPYVLEEALHEIYRDKGWNLSANINPRGTGPLAFPTLTDLYEKIDLVVSRLGYDERLSKDILAGLKTRINNLRLGGKGLMLDTRRSVDLALLMKKPVLVELKKLGNDDEKAFLIGLILTRLYEYYESRSQDFAPMGFRHLTLIEEAHRLLKHVSEEVSDAEGNVRGKAVETFCNMLSEIRAYGEGVLVAEQIPTKLARDVIKNTNLKIMHRMVARDDRDILGDAMNLTDEQKRYATTLEKGKAIVFAEGMDNPFLVSIPRPTSSQRGETEERVHINDALIASHMKPFYQHHREVLLRASVCEDCPVEITRCEPVREMGKELISTIRGKRVFSKIFMTLALCGPDPDLFQEAERTILEGVNLQSSVDPKSVLLCYLVQGADLMIDLQGREYNYPYSDMERLVFSFLEGAKSLIFEREGAHPFIDEFQRQFRRLRSRAKGPFVGCVACNHICLFRFEAGLWLEDKFVNQDFSHIASKVEQDSRGWLELARLCGQIAGSIYGGKDLDLSKGMALCYLSQKVGRAGYHRGIQEKVVRNVLKALEQG